MKPSDSGSVMSMQPKPFGEEITGMPSLRANAVSSRARLRQRDAMADEEYRALRP